MSCPRIAQSYANVPLLEKVCRKVSFRFSSPESKAPLFEVTVCGTESLFVQHTVEPGAIVTVCGANTYPLIETGVSPAAHPP
jgi:hypothetical protein